MFGKPTPGHRNMMSRKMTYLFSPDDDIGAGARSDIETAVDQKRSFFWFVKKNLVKTNMPIHL